MRQHAEKSDDSQSLKVVSSNRWDANGKTIYELSRAQYDDEAVALTQMKDTTDKKIDMDDLLPQTLILDYESSDNSDKYVVDKKYLVSKTLI